MQIEVPQCKLNIKSAVAANIDLIVAEETKKVQKIKKQKFSFVPNQKLLKSVKNS